MTNMADRLSGESQAWRPDLPQEKHPNPLMAKVVDIEMGEGDYGAFPILYLLDDDGTEWRWHVFGEVAQRRIARLQPAVGDRLGVKLLGDKPSRKFAGKSYRDWRVVIERADGKASAPDWAALAAAASGEDDEEDDF